MQFEYNWASSSRDVFVVPSCFSHVNPPKKGEHDPIRRKIIVASAWFESKPPPTEKKKKRQKESGTQNEGIEL